MNRWWIYQSERFPLAAHAPLVLAFSLSAQCYSALLGGRAGTVSVHSGVVGFLCCLLLFFQLRVADEFKDIEEDRRYRPYRPVPRGLVSLWELGVAGIAAAFIQVIAAASLDTVLLWVLLLTWIYLALMSKEFFVEAWLRERPLTYLWTHMLIMPCIDLFATACDWLVVGQAPKGALGWFLGASFFVGVSIEVGRKIRSPKDEEEGVNTYTRLYGPSRAVLMWCASLALAWGCAILAAIPISIAYSVLLGGGIIVGGALFLALYFVRELEQRSLGKWFEAATALSTVALYLLLGIIPYYLGAAWTSY